jgi:hypothetical protein
MSTPAGHPISLFAEVTLQAQVLVPVLRALRTELGRDKAGALLGRVLRDYVRARYERLP